MPTTISRGLNRLLHSLTRDTEGTSRAPATLNIEDADNRLTRLSVNDEGRNAILNQLSDGLSRTNSTYSCAKKAHAAFVIARHLAEQDTVVLNGAPFSRSQFASLAVELTLQSLRDQNVLSSADYAALHQRVELLLSNTPSNALFDFEQVKLQVAHGELQAKLADFERLQRVRQTVEPQDALMHADADINAYGQRLWGTGQSVHWAPVVSNAESVFDRVRARVGTNTCGASRAREQLTEWLQSQRKIVSWRSPMHRVYGRALECLQTYPSSNMRTGHGAHLDSLLPTLWTYLQNHSTNTAQQSAFKEAICGVLSEQMELQRYSDAGCAAGFAIRLRECFSTVDDELNQFGDVSRFNAHHDQLAQTIAANYLEQLGLEPAGNDGQAVVDRYIEKLHARLWFELCVGCGVAKDSLDPHAQRLAQGFTTDQLHDEVDAVNLNVLTERLAGRESMHATQAESSSSNVTRAASSPQTLEPSIEQAIAQGSLSQVFAALAANPNIVHATNANGFKPLHLAARYNRVDVAFALLAAGAGIEQRITNGGTPSFEGRTPLHVAAGSGSLNVMRMLISLHADTNARDSCGRVPVHLAAMYDQPAALAELLRGRESDANKTDLFRRTTLDFAKSSKNPNAVRIITHAQDTLAKVRTPRHS